MTPDRLDALLRERWGALDDLRHRDDVASDAVGDLSLNFSRSESACPHCGKCPEVSPHLVAVLQRARTAVGRPLQVVSGYRCTEHNRRVGGTPTSYHLTARAADVPRGYGTITQWKSWGAKGIGVRSGGVIHVDVRPGAKPVVFND